MCDNAERLKLIEEATRLFKSGYNGPTASQLI